MGGHAAWHPPDEATAASNLMVFIEWLRASGLLPEADPAEVAAWRARAPDAFAAAIAGFAGLDTQGSVRDAVRRAGGTLVLHRGGRRRVWRAGAMPPDIAMSLELPGWDVVLELVADHLLRAETRPDHRLLWDADQTDPWPLAALLVGATVILAEPGAGEALLGPEEAVRLTPLPSAPGAG
ncbi:MAG: hypothetical protein KGJ41_12095 [Rhodospirillales bacterium]|nr:hypothetical protein [Rhodospirillales bacterium]MDE2199750.1 hypothetical protein [Rhodospirillales bacterium]